MKNKYMYLLFAATISLTACHEDDQFKGELYKKVIYVLSDDNLLMSEEHDLNMEESVGHVSIGCGGTEHIQHDVMVGSKVFFLSCTRKQIVQYAIDFFIR